MTDAWEDLATYRQRQFQRHYLYLTKGVQVNPKAYCCTGPNTINTEKPPVAILTVTPNPIFETEFAKLDLTNSYDPDPAGIVKWTIWDGLGGAPYVRPPGANMFTNVQYNVGGRYEVIGVVEDGAGLQGQASTWLEVLSVGPPNPPEPPGDWRENIYLATNVNGIYYTEDFSGPGLGNPEWATVNTGLGTTNCRSIVGDPWDPAGRQYTRTTEPKIYRRTGGDWSVILDITIAAARLGFALVSVRFSNPVCNINAQGHVYVLVHYVQGGGGTAFYFFKSIDYGDNWLPPVLVDWTAAWVTWTPKQLLVGAFQGTSPYAAGQVIYAFYQGNASGDANLRASVNQGGLFGAEINMPWCGASGTDQEFNRSPADQDVLYRVIKGVSIGPTYHMRMDKSIDRGTNWPTALFACNTVPPNPQVVQRPNIYIWEPLGAFMAGGSAGLHWTEDDWANYFTYTNADNFDVDGCSRVMDSSEFLYGWQGNNPGGGDLQHVIAVTDDRGQNWDGKAGNDPVTPSATSIPNNCGGVAGILQIWTED